jgi:hypothetical protein
MGGAPRRHTTKILGVLHSFAHRYIFLLMPCGTIRKGKWLTTLNLGSTTSSDTSAIENFPKKSINCDIRVARF